jgi:hypothetical protein
VVSPKEAEVAPAGEPGLSAARSGICLPGSWLGVLPHEVQPVPAAAAGQAVQMRAGEHLLEPL